MPRVMTPELMDEPDADRAELARSLAFIRRVNARLGGTAALVSSLRRWSRRWPRDRPVTLVDLGTGSADIPAAAVAWARGAGFDLRVTAVDAHPVTLALAREHVERAGAADAVDLVECDARDLVDRFGVDRFDYAHAGMFLHHFDDVEVLTLLRSMERVSRAGLVWNDLLRSGWSWLGVRALTVGAAPMVRHDARVSVDKGFTASEVRGIAQRLGLGWARCATSPLLGRFTLAGERRAAWAGGASPR